MKLKVKYTFIQFLVSVDDRRFESTTLLWEVITCDFIVIIIFQRERRPVIHVFNAVTGETFPVVGSEAILHMSVAGLKTMVSVKSGLPVSTFRLSRPKDVQLYDCNQLQDYAIELGMVCFLSVLHDWCVCLHRLEHTESEFTVLHGKIFHHRVKIKQGCTFCWQRLQLWSQKLTCLQQGISLKAPIWWTKSIDFT